MRTYSLVRSLDRTDATGTVLASGLTWGEVTTLRDRLDREAQRANPEKTSWTRPLHFRRLEKPLTGAEV